MTRHVSSVSPKGQVTIPIDIREEFGIKPKGKVLFNVRDNLIIIKPLGSPVDALYRSVSPLENSLSWEEIRSIVRDEIALNAMTEDVESSKNGA